MLRRSFFYVMGVAVIGVRIEAQETIHGTASNGNAHFERCWGCRNIETREKKVGVFHKAAVGIFRGKLKQLNNNEIVIENEACVG